MTMFTYACLGSSDLRRSAAFYDPVLACLGLSRCRPKDQRDYDWEGWLGWGHYADDGLSELALWVCSPWTAKLRAPATRPCWRSGPAVGRRSTGFMQRPSLMADAQRESLGCGPTTTRISTPPMFAIPTVTSWRRSAVDGQSVAADRAAMTSTRTAREAVGA